MKRILTIIGILAVLALPDPCLAPQYRAHYGYDFRVFAMIRIQTHATGSDIDLILYHRR